MMYRARITEKGTLGLFQCAISCTEKNPYGFYFQPIQCKNRRNKMKRKMWLVLMALPALVIFSLGIGGINIQAEEPDCPECWNYAIQGQGDTNGDGLVSLADFIAFKGAFGTDYWNDWNDGTGRYNPCGDFNRDGYVGLGDFTTFKGNYGKEEIFPVGLPGAPWPPRHYEESTCFEDLFEEWGYDYNTGPAYIELTFSNGFVSCGTASKWECNGHSAADFNGRTIRCYFDPERSYYSTKSGWHVVYVREGLCSGSIGDYPTSGWLEVQTFHQNNQPHYIYIDFLVACSGPSCPGDPFHGLSFARDEWNPADIHDGSALNVVECPICGVSNCKREQGEGGTVTWTFPGFE
jgi:hypothetical protein